MKNTNRNDLMFPKPQKKKKKKIHKRSILQTEKGICYLCANLEDNWSYQYTEEHHIVYGSGQREVSEANGLKVDLCKRHHGTGKDGVHGSSQMRELLCSIAQQEFEQSHTREEWMELFKKNYL